jgi:tRNA A-37 threonylcarbamoyl transferase component Bud32
MTSPIAVLAGDVRWQVATEHRDLLLGPRGLRLEEWRRAGQVRIIKQGPHRTVYRVVLGGLSFFVKHNRLYDVRAWLRELVRPSKARMEYEHALAVAARGVPTFVPLAIGENRSVLGPGDSFLITLSLDHTEPVGSFIETTIPQFSPARRARVRQRLAQELGKLVARMHAAGIAHDDFHAGNLLVRLAPDDKPLLYVIDLHALRLGEPLNWREIRANLVMLNRWFVLRVSRADRLRFWRAYCQSLEAKGPWSQPSALPPRLPTSELARDLEKRTWASNLRFWESRDRRCLLNNRYYRQVQSTATQGHAVNDLDADTLELLLANPDEPFHRPGARLLKDSRSSTVTEFEVLVSGVRRHVIYKRFRVTAWSDPWAALLRRSPALRSWVHGHGLRERCLPTARPLAVLHRRRGGLHHEGYLLTEKVAGAVDLHGYLADVMSLTAPERRARLRHLVDHLARLSRELHRRRLSHRDLKAANILVSEPDIETGGPMCWLIDLVGVERYSALPRARRVQNLARLHASFHRSVLLSRTDKLRFLRVYLEWGLRGREGWKQWWREIEQATLAKIARNARKGRLLA